MWMSAQILGISAFRESVDQSLILATQAESYILQNANLEMLHHVVLSVICFRFAPAASNLDESAIEEINRIILARLFWDNESFVSSTMLHGKFALRVCILNYKCT